ncbi:MAG: hypothetical protein GX591_12355 [Planctomycetes bacterium]|nr:hypothetical protein [Planctomycetota bacterium]
MDPAALNILVNVLAFAAVFVGVLAGAEPLRRWVLGQERVYGHILRTSLLLDVRPRSATWFGAGCVAAAAAAGYLFMPGLVAPAAGGALGAAAPMITLRVLRARRRAKLDEQLVDGIQSLAGGVRAGLNLVGAMELVARNLPAPISQEFGHLLREYEYGTPIETAMANAAGRIALPNYRLVFSALQTHRERGGDLGSTLDRIAESVREIQRLENRIEALTAQNRAAARWMGAMPAVILAILYLIDPAGVGMLFTDTVGKILLVAIVAMNAVGFAWIRQIVSIDV